MDGASVLPDEELDGATPVCPHCLAPISAQDYYCKACGESVGQLTGIIPFVNIRFQANFLGRIWRTAWYDKEAGLGYRIFCMLLFFFIAAPIAVIGLPFVLWEKLRNRGRGR